MNIGQVVVFCVRLLVGLWANNEAAIFSVLLINGNMKATMPRGSKWGVNKGPTTNFVPVAP